ncbi:hypothetical protein CF319_g9398 [Tilletia indica]|nr:hypothetical protein CF319_g9398 [Tilletia indica]
MSRSRSLPLYSTTATTTHGPHADVSPQHTHTHAHAPLNDTDSNNRITIPSTTHSTAQQEEEVQAHTVKEGKAGAHEVLLIKAGAGEGHAVQDLAPPTDTIHGQHLDRALLFDNGALLRRPLPPDAKTTTVSAHHSSTMPSITDGQYA